MPPTPTPIFITQLDQITDQWLTAVLGVPVQIIDRRANDAFNSKLLHLTVQSNSPSTDLPTHLIVKLNVAGDGEYEVRYYGLANTQPAPPTTSPRAVACAYDAESGASYLVMADISDTHTVPVLRADVLALHGMPTETHLRQMAELMARFHAYWWEHPDLKAGALPVRWWYGDEAQFRAHVQRCERDWATFQSATSITDLPDEYRTFYSDLVARLPVLWTRYLEPRVTTFRALTVTNGDCYFAQFLCPKDEKDANGRAYLVDFQDASGNLPAFDLVFMFAIFWTIDHRREGDREMGLLRHYHAVLCDEGVTNYTWDDLLRDYRLALTLIVFFVVFDAASGASRSYWWPKIQCLVANFNDLNCFELFEEN